MRVAISIVLAINIIEIIYPVVIPFIDANYESSDWAVGIDELVINVTLTVVFIVVTVKMIKILNMFEESGGSFSRQKKSVIRQVVYFEVSFSYIILT